MTNSATEKDLDQLNSFLRGELSAVQTFDQAIKAADQTGVIAILEACRSDHAERSAILDNEVRKLGGKPAEGSGAWGAFAKAVEGGAAVFGTSAAIAALKTGEQHGLNDYERDLDDLTPSTRSFVAERLLPAQRRTLATVERLDDAL